MCDNKEGTAGLLRSCATNYGNYNWVQERRRGNGNNGRRRTDGGAIGSGATDMDVRAPSATLLELTAAIVIGSRSVKIMSDGDGGRRRNGHRSARVVAPRAQLAVRLP